MTGPWCNQNIYFGVLLEVKILIGQKSDCSLGFRSGVVPDVAVTNAKVLKAVFERANLTRAKKVRVQIKFVFVLSGLLIYTLGSHEAELYQFLQLEKKKKNTWTCGLHIKILN